MAHRFYAPPNWPAPPEGWVPPPGWQPDPAWGPPPPGWVVWEWCRANPQAWAWSLLSGSAWWVVVIAVLVATTGSLDPEVAGELLAPFLVGGAAVGLAAWLSKGRWPRWTYPLAVLGVALVLRALAVAGGGG